MTTTQQQTILTVDVGNTLVKVCVFEGGRLIQSSAGKVDTSEAVCAVVDAMLTYNSADGAAWCSVGREVDGLTEMLRDEYGLPVVKLDPSTPLPIRVEYGSRNTLGADRVAAAVGVSDPERAVLIVDAGTAVTSDIVADSTFLGGNISPGLRLRFASLHHYTSRLPLVEAEGEVPGFGHDTVTAIRAGVVGGLLAQIERDYRNAVSMFTNPRLVLTGGDAPFLAPLLREQGLTPEIVSDAVGRGLVRIFNYNNN